MSYRPHENPHSPSPQQGGYREDRERPRGDDGAETLANVIRLVTGAITAVFVLHVVFVVFDANQGNEFVSFVYGSAQVLVLGLGDVFTPDDAVLGVVLNYGLAALVYLVIGQLVITALRRR